MPLSPHRELLSNGLTVVVQENHATPAISALVVVSAGAVHDPPGGSGTAALAARMLDRGSTRLSAAALAEALDGCGAALGVAAGRHRTTISCTCLAEDFARVIELAADVVVSPAFPDAEVAVRRGELLTEIREAEDDPGAVAMDRLMSALYAGHPYGEPPLGRAESVSRLGRAHLEAFHAARFAPAATLVVIAGAVRAVEAVERTARAFEGWHAPPPPAVVLPPAPAPAARRVLAAPMMDKAQADVAYGLVGVARRDPAYDAALVMNHALGQYGIGGRLGDRIRERQGMAYYVSSRLDASVAAGPLVVRAGVAAANVERTLAAIDDEIAAVARGGLTEVEIDASKRYLIGSMPRRLETNAGIAAFLAEAEFFGLGLDYDRVFPERVAAVTAAEVHAVARRLLDPSRATIAVAGPWAGPIATGADAHA